MTTEPVDPELADRVRAWIDDDPDPRTRAELEDLLSAGDGTTLADRFRGPLTFGTAGLRGAIGAGPHRMNLAVVMRTAAGLAAYLHARGETGSVVIGYDARHHSADFAAGTASVLAGAGLEALLMPRALPTPVLAFAVREMGCAAGVMVTASHNPATDSGYKVYLGDGGQLAPPADAEIARHIAEVGTLAALPRGQGSVLGEDIVQSYLDVAAAAVPPGSRDLRVAYTALHGVGTELTLAAMGRAGFPAPVVVPEQADPDPRFPTVEFPNPEEPGATDLLLALAQRCGAQLAVAQDPDADRCAVAVPDPHGWQLLRGDELGVLLADDLLRRGRTGVFATSLVSSTLLPRLAAAYGQPHAVTLTGFKWIGRVEGLAYGYEEALGYCCFPGSVRDKDGITAMLLVCDLAARLKQQGLSLRDRLDEIARVHGLHATDQLVVRTNDPAEAERLVTRLREQPPGALGGLSVDLVEDLSTGVDGLPPTGGLRLRLQDGARVVVRPSGTEPKLKCYLEVLVSVEAADSPEHAADVVDAARIAAAGRLDAIRSDLRETLVR